MSREISLEETVVQGQSVINDEIANFLRPSSVLSESHVFTADFALKVYQLIVDTHKQSAFRSELYYEKSFLLWIKSCIETFKVDNSRPLHLFAGNGPYYLFTTFFASVEEMLCAFFSVFNRELMRVSQETPRFFSTLNAVLELCRGYIESGYPGLTIPKDIASTALIHQVNPAMKLSVYCETALPYITPLFPRYFLEKQYQTLLRACQKATEQAFYPAQLLTHIKAVIEESVNVSGDLERLLMLIVAYKKELKQDPFRNELMPIFVGLSETLKNHVAKVHPAIDIEASILEIDYTDFKNFYWNACIGAFEAVRKQLKDRNSTVVVSLLSRFFISWEAKFLSLFPKLRSTQFDLRLLLSLVVQFENAFKENQNFKKLKSPLKILFGVQLSDWEWVKDKQYFFDVVRQWLMDHIVKKIDFRKKINVCRQILLTSNPVFPQRLIYVFSRIEALFSRQISQRDCIHW